MPACLAIPLGTQVLIGIDAAIWIGMRLFVHLSDRGTRMIALCLMLLLGVAALVA